MPSECGILSSVTCPASQYFSTLAHKRHDNKILIEHKICIDFLYNCSHSKKKGARYDQKLHVQYPLFLLDFNETWTFSTCLRKILKYQISWKAVQWEWSSSVRRNGRADRQQDRHDKASSCTRIFLFFVRFVLCRQICCGPILYKEIVWNVYQTKFINTENLWPCADLIHSTI
jgi:hypothetical protein